NVEAYQAYLKGRYHWYHFTSEEYQKSLDAYGEAIAKDPNYALAYAGIADTYVSMTYEGLLLPKEGFEKARQALVKAEHLDDSLGELHLPAAAIRAYDWDWESAAKEYRMGVAESPNFAPLHRFYSQFLRNRGDWGDALVEMRKALELDPVSAETTKALGAVYHWAGQYDRAIEFYRKALELDPNFVDAHEYLSDVYARLGKSRESLEEEKQALVLSGDPESAAALARDYETQGHRTAFR